MQQVSRFGNIDIQRKNSKLDWHLREYEQLAKTEEREGAERLKLYERGILEQVRVREADGGECKRKKKD